MKNESKTETKPLSEIEMLRARLAELEEKESEKPEEKIQQDEYIPVMSLLPFNLNLSTKEGGQGSVKKFTRFGEIKRILYKDLMDIVEAHPNFLEDGYFYILHPGFIRQHGLDEIYSKLLTKEKIDLILNTKSDEVVAIYESAPEKQQKIIIQMLVAKMRENPDSVNLNVVAQISRVSKVDIATVAAENLEEEKAE